jgi:hypothetical protein
MYRAMIEGVMPVQMSFAGYNYDVVSGVLASLLVLVGWRRSLPIWVIWSFNLVGMLFLLIIFGIAIASLPPFAAFGPDRLNTWVSFFPYVYLPTVMVQLALLGHLLSFRKLAVERRENVELPAPAQSHS